jgi:hypothetical protein
MPALARALLRGVVGLAWPMATLYAQAPPCPTGTHSLVGVVTAAGIPRPGAVVVALWTAETGPRGARMAADSAGRFRLCLPAGPARLQAQAGSVRSPVVAVQLPRDTARDLALAADTAGLPLLQLPALTVRAAPLGPLAGFYERLRRRRGGYFVTREQIERLRPRVLTDVLLAIPGLQLVEALDGTRTVRFRGLPPLRIAAGPRPRVEIDCPPQIFLDGSRTSVGFGLDREVRPDDVEGIEVYSGPSVPAVFAGAQARCGVIAIWLRPTLDPTP